MSLVRCSHLYKFHFFLVIYEWLSLQMNKIINWGCYFLINLFDLCRAYVKPKTAIVIIFQAKVDASNPIGAPLISFLQIIKFYLKVLFVWKIFVNIHAMYSRLDTLKFMLFESISIATLWTLHNHIWPSNCYIIL